VEPLVDILNDVGFESQLWLENRSQLSCFISAISCPKQFAEFDISANPLSAVMNIFRLTRRLKIVKPSAVHCHQSRASFIPLFSASLAKVPVRIYHNHGAPYLGYKGPKRRGLWLLEFFNCLLATHVLTVTPTIREKMIESKIVSEKKVLCLGTGSVCGIDLDEFRIEKFNNEMRNKERQRLSIGADAFVVLYIGRPLARKGFDTLLQAWQIFCRLQPNAEKILLTAGCDLKDIVDITGICPAGVVPLGYVAELHQYYAACDVVTLPSRHEGMPYSLLEGAAAERALVASNIPGIDSLIKHNQNGLLAEPKSPDEFAQAFNLLYTKPQLRTELAVNARKTIEKYFDRRICKRLLIDYYYNIGLKTKNHS
jgi:glycosyltransferase involved in cell wall biosynthesis